MTLPRMMLNSPHLLWATPWKVSLQASQHLSTPIVKAFSHLKWVNSHQRRTKKDASQSLSTLPRIPPKLFTSSQPVLDTKSNSIACAQCRTCQTLQRREGIRAKSGTVIWHQSLIRHMQSLDNCSRWWPWSTWRSFQVLPQRVELRALAHH